MRILSILAAMAAAALMLSGTPASAETTHKPGTHMTRDA
jgi:hypothetical protein